MLPSSTASRTAFSIHDRRLTSLFDSAYPRLDVLEHPNSEMSAGQRLYVLNIDNYAWIVPFRDSGDFRLLITAFPSRKYTNIYLKEEG